MAARGHDNHVIDGINSYAQMHTRDEYLEMTKDFKSKIPPVEIHIHEGISVARDDLHGCSTKMRAGEFLFTQVEEEVVVYVAPRVGHAAMAIMDLCNMYGKKAVFFMPASRQVSDHQAYIIDRNPYEVHFERIAAMPNLNRIAEKYAKQQGYKFLPFGLSHPYVIAGFVRTCEDLIQRGYEFTDVWSAVSTGVLTRGLQIGFPDAKFHGVAVARNMKAGEVGRANLHSEPLAFVQNEKEENLPPFPCVRSYDAKVWKYIPKGDPKTLFWNVAAEIFAPETFDKSSIKSWRDWPKKKDKALKLV